MIIFLIWGIYRETTFHSWTLNVDVWKCTQLTVQDLSSLSQKQKKSKSFCIGEPLTSLHSSEPQRGTMVRKSRAEKWRRIKLPCLMEKYKEDYSHGKLILYWIWAGPLEGFLNPVFQKSLCKTLRGGCLEVLSHPSVEPTKREEGFSSEWRLPKNIKGWGWTSFDSRGASKEELPSFYQGRPLLWLCSLAGFLEISCCTLFVATEGKKK